MEPGGPSAEGLAHGGRERGGREVVARPLGPLDTDAQGDARAPKSDSLESPGPRGVPGVTDIHIEGFVGKDGSGRALLISKPALPSEREGSVLPDFAAREGSDQSFAESYSAVTEPVKRTSPLLSGDRFVANMETGILGTSDDEGNYSLTGGELAELLAADGAALSWDGASGRKGEDEGAGELGEIELSELSGADEPPRARHPAAPRYFDIDLDSVCPICHECGHQAEACPTLTAPRCFACGSTSHTVMNCPTACCFICGNLRQSCRCNSKRVRGAGQPKVKRGQNAGEELIDPRVIARMYVGECYRCGGAHSALVCPLFRHLAVRCCFCHGPHRSSACRVAGGLPRSRLFCTNCGGTDHYHIECGFKTALSVGGGVRLFSDERARVAAEYARLAGLPKPSEGGIGRGARAQKFGRRGQQERRGGAGVTIEMKRGGERQRNLARSDRQGPPTAQVAPRARDPPVKSNWKGAPQGKGRKPDQGKAGVSVELQKTGRKR